MRLNRVLHGFLALSLLTGPLACSDDSSKDNAAENIPVLDELYAAVQSLEVNMSRGYLMRAATEQQQTMFKQILQDIKVATLRLKKNPRDSKGLQQLHIASGEFKKIRTLEADQSPFDDLESKLMTALSTLASMQGLALSNLEQVLHDQIFTSDIAPFVSVVSENKAGGWAIGNHKENFFLKVPSTTNRPKIDAWLLSPLFDLTQVTNPGFQLTQAINSYGKPYEYIVSYLISENYESGNPELATWTPVTPARVPTGYGFSVSDTEIVDLKAYEGKKVVIALRYNSLDLLTNDNVTWQLSRFKLIGAGTLQKTDLTGFAAAPSGVSNGGSGGSSSSYAAAVKNDNCVNGRSDLFGIGKGYNIDSDKTLMPIHFQNPAAVPVLEADGKVKESGYQFFKSSASYPNVIIRGSAFSPQGNRVATDYLLSKPIEVTSIDDLCLSLREIIFDGNNSKFDLSTIAVVYSTAFAGNVEAVDWKVADFGKRVVNAGTARANKDGDKNKDLPTSGYSMRLKDVKVGDKLVVGLRYIGSNENAPWWGVESLRVSTRGTQTSNNSGNSNTLPTGPISKVSPAEANTPCANNDMQLIGIDNIAQHTKPKTVFRLLQESKEKKADGTEQTTPIVNGHDPIYTNIALRLSGYSRNGDIVGDAYLVSTPIEISSIENLCVSLSEVIFAGTSVVDLNNLQIVYSTDPNIDAAALGAVNWKVLDIPNAERIITAGTPVRNSTPVTKTLGALLKDVAVGDRLTIGVHYKSLVKSVPWWGIENLRVSFKSGPAAPPEVKPEEPATPPAPVPEEPATPPAPVPEEPATPPAPVPEEPATPPAPVPEEPATPPAPVPEEPATPPAPVPEESATPPAPVPEEPATPPAPVPEESATPPAVGPAPEGQ